MFKYHSLLRNRVEEGFNGLIPLSYRVILDYQELFEIKLSKLLIEMILEVDDILLELLRKNKKTE